MIMLNFDHKKENFKLASQRQLYDLSILEQMDDNRYTIEVLELIILEMPLELTELNNAVNNNDTEIIGQIAHKIKSTAGIIQAPDLCNLLDEIDSIAKTGSVNETLITLVEKTRNLYYAIEVALIQHILLLK